MFVPFNAAVIEEKKHDTFKRGGNSSNDLVYRHRCSLSDALTGFTISLTTLDNRTLNVPVTEIVNPQYVKIIRGEGMPISKRVGQRGDLRIEFDIHFPRGPMSNDKKAVLRSILSS